MSQAMETGAIPLREVRVRVVRADEERRWNELVRTHHYLGFRNLCGRRLRHVAVLGERWLALLGWHSAALQCAARERWIGWSNLQRRLRADWLARHGHELLLAETFVDPTRFAGTCYRATNWREVGFLPVEDRTHP